MLMVLVLQGRISNSLLFWSSASALQARILRDISNYRPFIGESKDIPFPTYQSFIDGEMLLTIPRRLPRFQIERWYSAQSAFISALKDYRITIVVKFVCRYCPELVLNLAMHRPYSHMSCVKLVDFDWEGRNGSVSYPMPKLIQELVDRQSSDGLIIKKADDF